jgi:surface antigen
MRRILIVIGILALLGVALFFIYPINASSDTPSVTKPKSVGDPVDSLDGVVVYYNGSVGNTSGRNLSEDGYNLGLKYQCVEFVKRYYFEHYQHRMPDSYGHAKDFFQAGVADGGLNARRNLRQYSQGSSKRPEKGDLIVFDGNIFNPYGHVAIVSKTSDNEIEIIQQNPGPTGSSRILLDQKKVNGQWQVNRDDVLGWLRK